MAAHLKPKLKYDVKVEDGIINFMEIPFLDISIRRFNPNHRYRFYLIEPTESFRWLFTVRFSNKDQSLYLTPHFTTAYSVQVIESDGIQTYKCAPEGDYHLSIHESGAINFTFLANKIRLREPLDRKEPMRKALTMAISQYENLKLATLEEINKPKGQHVYLPIIGISFHNPIFLSVFCVANYCEWSVPPLGNTFNMRYATRFEGKDYSYYFVVWQDTNIQNYTGDLAFSWR
jgi:hypothetical protein